LPLRADRQIKAISPAAELPERGIRYPLLIPCFYYDVARRALVRCAELLSWKPCRMAALFAILWIDCLADLAVAAGVTAGPRAQKAGCSGSLRKITHEPSVVK
jgi:hypothetical protein